MKFLFSVLVACALIGAVYCNHSYQQWEKITHLIKKIKHSIHENDLKAVFGKFPQAKFSSASSSVALRSPSSKGGLPIVFLHGMGDSCFNEGMQQITNVTGQHFNRYAVCIPGANNWIDDTLSSFLINMNTNVDHFAAAVAADPQLANGFYAVGFSQGNSVLRGYLERYNSPTAVKVLHVHGTLEGVSAFPRCPDSSQFCELFTEILGDLAYNPLMQTILFQADYFRDPMLITSDGYKQNSQIAAWNGENGSSFNTTFKTNFLKTQSLTMIKALADTMIDPKESEWYGSYQAGGFSTVLTMEETDWYKQDTFGLKTMNEQGRLAFNTSTGNHLQFTEQELFAWIVQAGFSD